MQCALTQNSKYVNKLFIVRNSAWIFVTLRDSKYGNTHGNALSAQHAGLLTHSSSSISISSHEQIGPLAFSTIALVRNSQTCYPGGSFNPLIGACSVFCILHWGKKAVDLWFRIIVIFSLNHTPGDFNTKMVVIICNKIIITNIIVKFINKIIYLTTIFVVIISLYECTNKCFFFSV